MAQYTPHHRTLGELFSRTTRDSLITVPDWQRSFSWDGSEVKAFWDDLNGFIEEYGADLRGHEYFLGSIVLVEKADRCELLDGQQRLATATILLSVIRDYLSRYNKDASTRLSTTYLVHIDDATDERLYKLTLGNYDSEFFRREIQDRYDSSVPRPEPKLLSHKLIRKAREFFERTFEGKYQELSGGERAYRWALSIRQGLTDHLSVVEISSRDEDDAAEVFETLNYRGIDLSNTDLIRTLVLRSSQDNERSQINDAWENIFEIGERVEEFLRHWWLSYYGDLTGRGLYKAFKPKVIEGEWKSIDLTRHLDSAADTYKLLIACRDDNSDVSALLHDLKDLGAKLFYPVLLSIYSSDAYRLQRARVLQTILALYIRYNVIGGLEGTQLEPKVYSLARDLRSSESVLYAERMWDSAPDDLKFELDFRTAQVPRQATARYLLRKIEEAKRNTAEVGVLGSSTVQVEHIYPQNPREGYRLDEHDAVLQRIGNLTLLSARLNQRLRNAPFAEKKPTYAASQLLITQELTQYDEWGLDSIAARQMEFAEQAVRIWAFPK